MRKWNFEKRTVVSPVVLAWVAFLAFGAVAVALMFMPASAECGNLCTGMCTGSQGCFSGCSCLGGMCG